MTDTVIITRILRAALREAPGPYRLRLALAEYARIKAEQEREQKPT